MKVRTLIFSIYLLALTLYPCSDAFTCSDDFGSPEKSKLELAKHDHSEDEGDVCSPFCICSCCSVSIRITHPEVSIPELTHHTLHIIPFQELPLLDNTHAIWQPPRIG